jgi:hypothetical protein
MLNTAVAEIDSHEILIANGSDVLGLIYAYDAEEAQDLSTIAGEIVNYRRRI